jgi:hypothetical protein
MSFPTNDTLKAELISLGYTGDVNDGITSYIKTRHTITGSFNDLLYFHLGAKGLTGSLTDRIKVWNGILFLA